MLGNLCTKGSLWKGKYFYYTKHCLYLTMRQKYRTTEFISVRLMYLGHVLHRLSNYFLMSKICQGVYAKGPPPFSLTRVFPFPFSFERPPRRLSEKDTTVTLSRVNRMTARPARRSMQGCPYHYYSPYSFFLYLPKGLDPLVNISSPLTVPYNGIPPIPPINEQSPNCKLLRPSERENSKLVWVYFNLILALHCL